MSETHINVRYAEQSAMGDLGTQSRDQSAEGFWLRPNESLFKETQARYPFELYLREALSTVNVERRLISVGGISIRTALEAVLP